MARGVERAMVARGVSLAVALCLAISCNSPDTRQITKNTAPSPLSCTVSALEPDPNSQYGLARAGPLWFSAFGRVAPGTPARLANGESYDGWKVVIHPDPSAAGRATVSGVQCSSGQPVRFCYHNCDWTTSNGRLKTSSPTLSVDAGQHLDYTGYMVFPGPGQMRLSVTDSSGATASVVIEVPAL
jgi:hypothetical protein